MAWTTPHTWNNEIATGAQWTIELRDNQRALKYPPAAGYQADELTDYATISSTYANVDGTNYNFSLSTTGGDVMLGFMGGGTGVYIDVLVDGNRVINDTDGGLVDCTAYGSGACFIHILTGLAAGVHTFVLQFKTAGLGGTILAGAGTPNLDIQSFFFVQEIS